MTPYNLAAMALPFPSPHEVVGRARVGGVCAMTLSMRTMHLAMRETPSILPSRTTPHPYPSPPLRGGRGNPAFELDKSECLS